MLSSIALKFEEHVPLKTSIFSTILWLEMQAVLFSCKVEDLVNYVIPVQSDK